MVDNFLISLRDDFPKGSGVPSTGIGATTYINIAPDALKYNLKNDGVHPDQWLHRLRATNESLLVFVHGFADDAEKVIARHNAIKSNLPPDEFTVVSFDWPAGNFPLEPIKGYKQDKANATAIASKLLDDCLQLLLYHFDAKNIHLFAHSMGAYVTETAFQGQGSVKINHVLMAAADVDRKHYNPGSDFLTNFLGKCADLTAYYSTADKALWASINDMGNTYIPLGLRGYEGWAEPPRQSLQCTDYFHVYVESTTPPPGEKLAWSHIWYIFFKPDPTNPPPWANDFFVDMIEVLEDKPKVPTRAERYLLKARGDLPTASESS